MRHDRESLNGGKRLPGDEHFVEPTVLAHARPEMAVTREEIFGPVICVASFDDAAGLEEIVALANDSDYGLVARVWTRDLGTATRRRHQAAACASALRSSAWPHAPTLSSALCRERPALSRRAYAYAGLRPGACVGFGSALHESAICHASHALV